MLQQNAVAPATLELLKKICAINELKSFAETRLLSVEDIIPMKLQAASNRNSKKDYWDIAALLEKYSLYTMLKIFSAKFPQIDIGFIIHSLTDFEKADTELDPDTNTGISWNEIKKKLIIAVKQYTDGLL
ncbi:MAG TPA: nucleotidyl transferase AbiEii/AbiGii toxin family protein [Hanamia sp.]|nr:nucleotidyl transferase AbiEii/AbiGii toxin family protein [Hanamia sp.]